MVQMLYRKQHFPKDVKKIPYLGPIIQKCWHNEYDSVSELVKVLETIYTGPVKKQSPFVTYADSANPVVVPAEHNMVEVRKNHGQGRTRRKQCVQYSHKKPDLRREHNMGTVIKYEGRSGSKRDWVMKFFSWKKPQQRSKVAQSYYY
jgi:hypothetical protein